MVTTESAMIKISAEILSFSDVFIQVPGKNYCLILVPYSIIPVIKNKNI
jgi:hypothetical protein